MVKVMCFGTFDGLHRGHEHYLKESARLGDFLVVVVARDVTVREVKGRLPSRSESERLAAVSRLPFVQRAVLGNPGDKLRVVLDERPDIICLGYDQVSFTGGLEEKLRAGGLDVRVVRISPFMPDVYKSSRILDGVRKQGA